ncbi:MAG: protein translocase SEC61 complex subunit gamma [Candidatus Baldrarchaeia archaeon]|nr:protein translocase SEC61 complex subunit gamma [Candidatus Baldrarchaeota archaeon]
MDIESFLRNVRRLLKLAKKPTGEELKLSIRISVIGILIIGLIAFLIRLIFALLFR